MPKIGDKISRDMFHVSPCNMRADKPFGADKEDKNLVDQLRHGKIEQPFKVRPEKKGYVVSNISANGIVEVELKSHEGFGVYLGRRRYLGEIVLGKKVFTLGEDFNLKNVSEQEAKESSWIENWEILKKHPNPIERAKGLRNTMLGSTRSLRSWAARWGAKPSTLSEYLKVLELSPKMQDVLAKELLLYSDARQILRMGLGNELQEKLAEILESDGLEAFKNELARIPTGKMKRGLPKDVYFILRATFDRRYKPDLELWEKIQKGAKQKNMNEDEYIKWFLRENL